MDWQRLLSFLFLVNIALSVSAKETDNLTDRYKALNDSTEILDAEMNKRLQETVQQANKENIPCNNNKKIRILFHDLNQESFFVGSLESWSEDNAQVAKRSAQPKNSIYEGVLDNGLIFNNVQLSSTIKVNNELIGTDKLGHFIDQGFTLFTPYRIRGYTASSMKDALVSSFALEKGALGKSSTGTISYADSMANHGGILFYHNLVEGNSPYLTCREGQWRQAKDFTWKTYVNSGWDEGINCSQIADSEKKEVYEKNIKKLEASTAARQQEFSYRCPTDPVACGKLAREFSYVSESVLSPECRAAGKTNYGSGTGSGTGSGSSSPTGKTQ